MVCEYRRKGRISWEGFWLNRCRERWPRHLTEEADEPPYVLHRRSQEELKAWQAETPYNKPVVNGRTYDMAGNVLSRFGFHCFRQTLASFLLAQGNNPVLIKNLPRWSKISMLETYGHVMTDEKIAAQGSMLERIMPNPNAVQ